MKLNTLVLLALAALPAGLTAQEPRWIVRSLPHADVWYAALAQLPFEGFGEFALYDADFARQARAAKRGALAETALDRERATLQAALSRDSAFEVLHFVPLYFAGTDRQGMFAALRAVAGGQDPATVADPRARFGAAVVAAVLATPAQRAVLGRLVAAVEDEWQQYFGRWWTDGAGARSRQADSAQALWDGVLAAPLATVLRRAALDSGMIVVSPALGPEGRIFAGRPEHRSDNVVAVRLPAGAAGAATAAVSVVRELCYPVATAVVAEHGRGDRRAGEQASGRLAVRCGAMLIERSPADVRRAYERAYAGRRAIADRFPVDSIFLRELRTRLSP